MGLVKQFLCLCRCAWPLLNSAQTGDGFVIMSVLHIDKSQIDMGFRIFCIQPQGQVKLRPCFLFAACEQMQGADGNKGFGFSFEG